MADSHVTIARAKSAELEARFLYYWLNSRPFQEYVYAALVVGATNQIELNRDRLGDAPVPLPPLEEQRRIADFLDAETTRIDHLSKLSKLLLERIDERDQSLRSSLVDQLATNEGEIPLRRLTARVEQGSSPQCESAPRQDPFEWGVLKLSSVKRGAFDASENKRLPDGTQPVRDHAVRAGDLLVTRANTPALVGDTAVVHDDCEKLLLPDLIYRVVLLPGVRPDYVMQVVLSGRTRSLIESVARGSSQSMVKLRGEDIKAWPIPIATPSQQDSLVQRISRETEISNKLRTKIWHQQTLLTERRQALITAAVTGQIDVSTASGRNVTEGIPS
ncbi:hypothetical protein GCM10009799_42370 [Nocardiopsis rhodophaea]|uniref:Type I restriction modification DNA specificity domain-containing protein n=2 Tax=Nocardiopsis rhodophaea TaxID=280238 RepID=A0ABN2TJ76_9ACTN